jgi:hypothetical protein
MTNMVAHLNLAINMFDADGELLDGKDEDSRTFDEQNAFMSYQAFIGETYFGPGSGSNQPGLEKMAGTLSKSWTTFLSISTLHSNSPQKDLFMRRIIRHERSCLR